MTEFQKEVAKWAEACFGKEISSNKVERNHRFLEEALELVQSLNCTKKEAHQLVDYVFDRDVGEVHQELGGVMVTLATLSNANGLNMQEDANIELARIWTKIEKIRTKQKAKPKMGPLPIETLAQDQINLSTEQTEVLNKNFWNFVDETSK